MPEKRRRYPLLALAAYTLVPGERRVRAMNHFRRAGFEVLRGIGALAMPIQKPGESEGARRERIEIE